MKEQAIPILNFILKKISNEKIRIPKATDIWVDNLHIRFDRQTNEMEYNIDYNFNNKNFSLSGVLIGEEILNGLHKSLENLLYVGFWVKRKCTRSAVDFCIKQIEVENEDRVNYLIVYVCGDVLRDFKYVVSDESNFEKSLKSPVSLMYSDEIYSFTVE